MKSLAELKEIKEKALSQINLRNDNGGYRVVVGMATCGIAAGARPVMTMFNDEINKRGLNNASVTMAGCIGICRLEPVVEIYNPDGSKVTYVNMSADMAKRVVNEHLVNGKTVSEFTIAAAEKEV